MKTTVLLLFLLPPTLSFGQSTVGSVNVGAYSSNNLIYSVGDIFVNPVSNANDANSGLIGAMSRISFFVSGIEDEITSDDFRAYPNPTNSTLHFSSSNQRFGAIHIYDISGKLVAQTSDLQNPIDLTSLPSGTYIVSTDNKNIQPLKVIKQ